MPIRPNASRTPAASPASGRSAWAASAADLISVWPVWWSVAAVLSMMQYMTTTLKNMPVMTSTAAYFNSLSVAPRRCHSLVRPMCTSSSTSWLDCQKNR